MIRPGHETAKFFAPYPSRVLVNGRNTIQLRFYFMWDQG